MLIDDDAQNRLSDDRPILCQRVVPIHGTFAEIKYLEKGRMQISVLFKRLICVFLSRPT